MTETIQISTDGEFSIEELKKLAQCIRDIEQNDIKRQINVFMNMPGKTVKQMEEVNDSVKPGFGFRKTILTGDGIV